MYTAVVLDKSSVELLAERMRETIDLEAEGYSCDGPEGYNLPHHMTLNLGKLDTKLNPEWMLNAECELIVDAFLWSDKIGACAARVIEALAFDGAGNPGELASFNDGKSHKHITTCLKPGVKPFKSNALWEQFSQGHVKVFRFENTLKLEGMLHECK